MQKFLLLCLTVFSQRQTNFHKETPAFNDNDILNDSLKNQLISNAHWANAAYCSKEQLLNWSCGTSCSFPKNELSVKYVGSDWFSGSSVYLAIHTKEPKIIVSFRGTRNFQSFLEDLNAIKLDYRYKNGLVHSGFYRGYARVSQDLVKTLRVFLDLPKYKNHTIVVTGHSYGGALAVFLGLELRLDLQYPNPVLLRTFLAPRVGDQVFSDLVTKTFFDQYQNSNPYPILRVTQSNDPVIHLPITLMGFRHFPHEILVKKESVLSPCADWGKYPNGTFYSLEDKSCSTSKIGWNFSSHIHLLGVGFGVSCS